MGASQSVPRAATPEERADQLLASRFYNNQYTVASLLMHQQQHTAAPSRPAQCPIAHGESAPRDSDVLNPLNYMPDISQKSAPGQKVQLSQERVVSSIARAPLSASPGSSPYDAPLQTATCPVSHNGASGEEPTHWEYPSPQQFYNALLRKGMETEEEAIETMVFIHNFLNERAWKEVVDWERRAGSDISQLQLARFQGRPGNLSPRARLFGWLGWIMPDKFNTEPPFDRHDWIVRRGPKDIDSAGEEVRYIIDYYSGPEHEDSEEEASFNLDVRPALDSFGAARQRWEKLLEEYRTGELFAPFKAQNEPPNSDIPASA
ncbi:holocytochrome-c synthase [Malassezia vespertilionis]|uniref:Holocytochrome c-type synthase n=1 Tax=Malassezia vespertilionis TaxID=2020962 RepID=A0A2N1JCZ0_9BASI|nr:holocytochrome-c synthase [Malassezia vespertilionis]PKI84397.1 Cyc3p [Malassezia vespertilionis]WFD06212.1 holocytochrome-c synthase [Malassezia vespertilionis]